MPLFENLSKGFTEMPLVAVQKPEMPPESEEKTYICLMPILLYMKQPLKKPEMWHLWVQKLQLRVFIFNRLKIQAILIVLKGVY